MKNMPWCYKCTGDVCVSTEPYIYIAAQIGKAISDVFTGLHRLCSCGTIDCFCDSPVGDEA